VRASDRDGCLRGLPQPGRLVLVFAHRADANPAPASGLGQPIWAVISAIERYWQVAAAQTKVWKTSW
jgi:hypothetical protein